MVDDPNLTTEDTSTDEIKTEDAIQDPGQFEGIAKPTEKEEFQGKIQDRIDELTRNWRGTERDLKAAIGKLTERDEEIEVLINQNQKLMAIADGKAQGQRRALDPEEGLNIEIKNIRSQMSEARKKLEWDVYDQLEDKMNDLNNQLVTVKVKKATAGRQTTDGSTEVNKNTVAEFTANNSWFDPTSPDFDPIMRGAALEYDDMLLTKKEWKDKPLSVRLKEVKRQVEKRFNTGGKMGPPNVEQPRRIETGNETGDLKTFGLSDVEKRIADKMIPLASSEERYKEYARQKKMG